MKYFKHNAGQITKSLFTKKPSVGREDTMESVYALSYISMGHMFSTVASNGFKYYYFFSYDKQNIEIAEYIFGKNGIYPVRHDSSLYHGEKVVLRIPYFMLLCNKNAHRFMDLLLCDMWHTKQYKCSLTEYENCFKKLKQEMKQVIK